MQLDPQAVINGIEIVVGVLVVVMGIVGRVVERRATETSRSAIKLVTASIILIVGLALVTYPVARRIGPIVTVSALYLGLALAFALIGGFAIGYARKKQNRVNTAVTSMTAVVLMGLALWGLFIGVDPGTEHVEENQDATVWSLFIRPHGLQTILNQAKRMGVIREKTVEIKQALDSPGNLKNIYNAINLYSQDWDALPPAANWMDNQDLVSKISDNGSLHCPAVSNGVDQKYGYAYNDNVAGGKLNGKKLDQLPGAAKTPLLFESTDLSKSAHDALKSLPNPGRYGGRNNILYLDGHVEAVAP